MDNIRIIVIMCCVVFFLGVSSAMAAEPNIGVIKIVKGQASIVRNQKSLPAKVGDGLLENDEIVTGREGSLGMIMKDNSVLSIGSNTRLRISKFVFEPVENKLSMVNRLERGTLVYLSGLIAKLKPEAVRLETLTAVCGIRGTHVAIKANDK